MTYARPFVTGDHHRLCPLRFDAVDTEEGHDVLDEAHCAECGAELTERESGRPVCSECDEKLERELSAWLSFVAVCRE